jgi:branched-subunit amino acid aminotransferase/4-amino-4-deoxychorismate lyase
MLLVHPHSGDVLEGASSNVFAIVGGEVYTAEEGVLHGSVRDTVLAACRDNGVPVHLRPPPGGAAGVVDGWEGALISSTSRLAMPLDAVLVPRTAIPRFAAAAAAAAVLASHSASGAGGELPPMPPVRVELLAGPDSLAGQIATWVEAKVGAASVKLL